MKLSNILAGYVPDENGRVSIRKEYFDKLLNLGQLEVLEPIDKGLMQRELREWQIKEGGDLSDSHLYLIAEFICQRFGTPAVGTGKQVDEPTVKGIVHKALDIDNLLKNKEIMGLLPETMEELLKAEDEIIQAVCKLSSARSEVTDKDKCNHHCTRTMKGMDIYCSNCGKKLDNELSEWGHGWHQGFKDSSTPIYSFMKGSTARSEVDEDRLKDEIQLRYFKLMYPDITESDAEIVAGSLAKAISAFLKGLTPSQQTARREDEDNNRNRGR